MAADMYRINTTLTGIPGAPYYNRLYFQLVAGTAQDALDATVAFWTAVDNLFANDLTWTVDGQVEEVESATGNITDITAGTGGTGSGADATSYLPQINQMLVRLRTGVFFNGREVRGRIFIPGATEAASADGILDSAWVTTMNSALATLVGDADSALMVYSPTHASGAPVTAATVWTQFASLRSRRD